MKKFISLVAGVMAFATVGIAEVKQESASVTVITTNQGTGALRIRGELKNLYVNVPATKTGTVNIVSSEGFNILCATNITTDTLYLPRVPTHTVLTTAITETGGGATNDTLNVIYDTMAVVGDCTVTIIPLATSTGTNTWTIQANFIQ